MCGITGAIAFTEKGKKYLEKIDDAVKSLRHRGPDGNGVFRDGNVVLGHTRLAIIDTSDLAAQPFTSADGRYTIVFNGEIFNYRELRIELENAGVKFRSQSDTEVLLELYAKEKEKCLSKLNGFFAFAIYDKNEKTLFLARDRYGEKPLYHKRTQEAFFFGSSIDSLRAFGDPEQISRTETSLFFHLNYIPDRNTIYESIQKVQPGSCGYTDSKTASSNFNFWYLLPNWHVLSNDPKRKTDPPVYDHAKIQLRALCENAVQRRLVSDVPLGSFLSGGIDSSIITALAAKHKDNLETFSIGFADEPYFDETEYAKLVSKHLGTKHHVFSLTNKDLLESLHEFLAIIDEPFADSSALAVNILAKKTRAHVTVALSGDGADELFAGYNKHEAEFRIRSNNFSNSLIKMGAPVWNLLPASRNSSFGNRIRQLRKFAEISKLGAKERYWRMAGFTSKNDLKQLIKRENWLPYESFKNEELLCYIRENGDFNDVLEADMAIVLEGDMLVKVDRMSMLHGLEVRSPFLDHEVVDFVMQLPSAYKIDKHSRKKILKESFANLLPAEIFTRKKQGFEVPLLKWFKTDLRGMIDELLNEKFLKDQNIFHHEEVKKIRTQMESNNPGDSVARIWGLIVFQKWWMKYSGR